MSDKKIPCIECTPETWKYIRPHLEEWGYKCSASRGEISKDWNLLIINWNHHLGKYDFGAIGSHLDGTRELLKDVEEFLYRAAKLKGFHYKRKDINNFTKKDLKPGMVVEDRKENKYLVCEFNGRINFISEKSWNPASAFNEDLTCVTLDEFDIMKVYNSNNVMGLIPLLSNHGDSLCLIWERQEPKEVVITMDEIAKKFGYPVKAIKIKK